MPHVIKIQRPEPKRPGCVYSTPLRTVRGGPSRGYASTKECKSNTHLQPPDRPPISLFDYPFSPFSSPHSPFSFLVSLPLCSLPVSLSQFFHLDSPWFLPSHFPSIFSLIAVSRLPSLGRRQCQGKTWQGKAKHGKARLS